MESDSTLPWVVLAISGFSFCLVSLLKSSVLSVRRERVQMLVAQGTGGADSLERLHSTPFGPASSLTLLKFLIIGLSLASGAALLSTLESVHWAAQYGVGLAVLAGLGLLQVVVIGLSRVFGESVALRTASIAFRFSRILTPLLALGTLVVDAVASGSSGMDDEGESVSGDHNGPGGVNGEPMDEREARMIRGVVGLDHTTAREIMVPRGDMVAVEMGTTLVDLVGRMLDSGHSRIPVYGEDLDHIEGVAYSRDFLGLLSTNPTPEALAGDHMRPALFIPEAKNLEELLNEFQARQVHLAIVIDEYGGVSGLVTIEDLLEEIVGEIQDEFDVDELEIQTTGRDEYLLDARVSIDQLDELMGVVVEADGFDTVGGFVYDRLGRIPSRGDLVFNDGLKIEVVSTVGRRLKKLRVSRS